MTLFDKMVSDMKQQPDVMEDNIQHEVMQKIALAGLARGGFFEKAAFDARIDAIDFDNARADVEPYVMDRTELDIWSAEFFRQMVRMITFA